jgi:hypothetical protein
VEGTLAGPGLQILGAIVAGGPGLVAVGSDESEGDSDAAVWVSADGYVWREVPHDAANLGGPGFQVMNAVTAGGPGLVAVGIDDPEGSIAEGLVDPDAAVWVSTDGIAWTRVAHDESLFGGPDAQRMVDITVAGRGLVAVGSDYHDGSTWPDGAVWVSADGYAWGRVDDPAIFGGPGGQEILSVAAGGPGVVAVGSGESYLNAAVWVSEDGESWSRVANDSEVFGGGSEMTSVMAAGPGLVAVGGSTGGGGLLKVWESADGRSWILNDDEALSARGLAVDAATLWEGGLAVVGKDALGDQTSVVFCLSGDGRGWDRIDPDDGVFADPNDLELVALTGWSAGLILLAGDVSTDDWDGVVWVISPAR